MVHQLLKGVAEDFCIKEPVAPERAARRALLGPMLAEEPSPAVLAFCRKWRELAHAAYAKAASLPAAQHAEANLALRLGVVGPEVRGALSAARPPRRAARSPPSSSGWSRRCAPRGLRGDRRLLAAARLWRGRWRRWGRRRDGGRGGGR